MSNMTPQDIQRIRDALSTARMSTYDLAVVAGGKSALDLYAWNAEISGALLGPLHLCEIVIRNAVSDALTTVYQQNWPWNPSFERSLPQQRKNELIATRNRHPNTGKVIPDLTFFSGKTCSQTGTLAVYGILIFNVFSQTWARNSQTSRKGSISMMSWMQYGNCATA
ncbi:hypothetical protein [Candidatus Pantoea bituminis]|uniref:hypothetical protein n=1 Tax=Candidatus Pantoea bituminis TaxID=2831036 RepID=UPI001C062D7B|nr:hypothetical protein [Pantoea bituminis]